MHSARDPICAVMKIGCLFLLRNPGCTVLMACVGVQQAPGNWALGLL
jgi:hypothetical protein